MLHYERSVFIEAPVERVFAFHERPDALELLTPPGQEIQMLRRGGGLRAGAEVEFLVPVGLFRMRWLARHTAYERDRLFVDEQVSGPFAKWKHCHQFRAEGVGCRLTDSVDFELPFAPLSEWVAGWAVRRRLASLFQYRHAATRRYCEPGG
jgi:ligand-binding SRPBCC domain-containing protein